MSRVGKYPVIVPADVTVDVKGQHVKVKGKLGELEYTAADDVDLKFEDNKLWVSPRKSETGINRSSWGTTRARPERRKRTAVCCRVVCRLSCRDGVLHQAAFQKFSSLRKKAMILFLTALLLMTIGACRGAEKTIDARQRTSATGFHHLFPWRFLISNGRPVFRNS